MSVYLFGAYIFDSLSVLFPKGKLLEINLLGQQHIHKIFNWIMSYKTVEIIKSWWYMKRHLVKEAWEWFSTPPLANGDANISFGMQPACTTQSAIFQKEEDHQPESKTAKNGVNLNNGEGGKGVHMSTLSKNHTARWESDQEKQVRSERCLYHNHAV